MPNLWDQNALFADSLFRDDITARDVYIEPDNYNFDTLLGAVMAKMPSEFFPDCGLSEDGVRGGDLIFAIRAHSEVDGYPVEITEHAARKEVDARLEEVWHKEKQEIEFTLKIRGSIYPMNRPPHLQRELSKKEWDEEWDATEWQIMEELSAKRLKINDKYSVRIPDSTELKDLYSVLRKRIALLQECKIDLNSYWSAVQRHKFGEVMNKHNIPKMYDTVEEVQEEDTPQDKANRECFSDAIDWLIAAIVGPGHKAYSKLEEVAPLFRDEVCEREKGL